MRMSDLEELTKTLSHIHCATRDAPKILNCIIKYQVASLKPG